MIKKEIYPKTERIKNSGEKVYVTEKLDGSNLVFFKKNDKLYFAQRKNVICFDELEKCKDKLYKGFYEWILRNKDVLESELYEGSAICGEWLGMGQIKYTVDVFDKRWYMFAKGRIDDDFNLSSLQYNHENFIYPFISGKIPSFLGVVPEVAELSVLPDKKYLDSIYEKYTRGVKRTVEGFVINYKDHINKYVRIKNGKLVEYSDNDHKGKEEN